MPSVNLPGGSWLALGAAVLVAILLVFQVHAQDVDPFQDSHADGPDDSASRALEEQLVSFAGEVGALGGFLWKPEGMGPFPAVVYNHGSERLPGSKPVVGRVFVAQGYVMLVPHRRGHGRSPGPYIADQVQQAPTAERNRLTVELLEAQVADQLAGLNYLRTLPYVDQSQVAVAGCSYGGIQTLLGAEANPGYRAAVNFAGAAQSWAGNPVLRERLMRAVPAISVPVFLLQAENDYDLAPTRSLAAEFERLGKPYRAEIFPPYGMTRDDGHSGFCFQGTDVWGPAVFEFLGSVLG